MLGDVFFKLACIVYVWSISNIARNVKVCILWKFIQYTVHWDKTQVLKKISFGKKNVTKNVIPFFFCDLQIIIVLLLICHSYISWSTRLVSLKLCVGFSIFDCVAFLLKLIFFSTKCIDSSTLKRHNSIQN